jgi:hypothetical protein
VADVLGRAAAGGFGAGAVVSGALLVHVSAALLTMGGFAIIYMGTAVVRGEFTSI